VAMVPRPCAAAYVPRPGAPPLMPPEKATTPQRTVAALRAAWSQDLTPGVIGAESPIVTGKISHQARQVCGGVARNVLPIERHGPVALHEGQQDDVSRRTPGRVRPGQRSIRPSLSSEATNLAKGINFPT